MNVKKIIIRPDDITDKNIQIPINLESKPMDNSELVSEYVEQLKRGAVADECLDHEKYRYNLICGNLALPNIDPLNPFDILDDFDPNDFIESGNCENFNFKFNFLNQEQENYINNVSNFNFSWGHLFATQDILDGRQRFTKSFWRFDFFSSNKTENQRPLFFKIFNTQPIQTSEFSLPFNNPNQCIYWYGANNDCILDFDNNGERKMYFRVRFFNASNGRVYHFFRTIREDSLSLLSSGGIPTMDEYSKNFSQYLFTEIIMLDDYTYIIEGSKLNTLFFNEIKIRNNS